MKFYIRYFIISALILLSINGSSYAVGKRTKVVLYNINFGALVGGIGSLINQKPGQEWYEAFFYGFCKGAAGGLVMYGGKELTGLIAERQRLEYGWPAKLVHTTGISMVENAASNRGILDTWNIHFGPLRLETRPFDLDGKVRFCPYAAGTFVRAATIGSWDPWKSILTGTPYFSFRHRAGGATLGNEILADESSSRPYCSVAHEYVHIMQHREFNSLNCLFLPIDNLFMENYVYKQVSNYVYFDVPFFYPAYRLEGVRDADDPDYHNNYYEMEADFFSE